MSEKYTVLTIRLYGTDLDRASKAARKLRIKRTDFIRMAIQNETKAALAARPVAA